MLTNISQIPWLFITLLSSSFLLLSHLDPLQNLIMVFPILFLRTAESKFFSPLYSNVLYLFIDTSLSTSPPSSASSGFSFWGGKKPSCVSWTLRWPFHQVSTHLSYWRKHSLLQPCSSLAANIQVSSTNQKKAYCVAPAFNMQCWLQKYISSKWRLPKQQNHRMGQREGTTVGHLVQLPCSSRVILEQLAQDCVQTVPEYLSPVRETAQPLWATCTKIQPLPQ